MSTSALVADVVTSFKANGRIVIVGASLAGLRAAEALRDEGFTGKLTLIGDEKHEPYDRPPLSKQVLKGWVPANHTLLPRSREIDAEWRLGVAATGLDRKTKNVRLANGDLIPYDRLLIDTGVRSRPWFNKEEASFRPIHDPTSETRARAGGAAANRSVSHHRGASSARDGPSSVSSSSRSPSPSARAPLIGALGGVIGKIAAEMQRGRS